MDRRPAAFDHPAPGLNRAALLARLRDVLVFARTNVAAIERHAPYWPADKAAIVTQADKVIVESALLALLASRVAGAPPPIAGEVAALARLLGPLARSESNAVRLLRFPQTAASLGIAHICLSALGERDEGFDRLVRAAFASGHVEAIERLPYRAMDLAWLRGVHDPSGPADFHSVLPHSILNSAAHPLYMAEMDVYALTHAFMYLTDFGARTLPRDVPPARASETVDACLAWQLLTANMDLLGELLLSAALAGGPWSPYARLGFRMLTAVWDELGFLPSAAFDVARYRALSGDEASAYAFHHVYHTTYVGGILCSVLLRPPVRGARHEAWTSSARPGASLLRECGGVVRVARRFCRDDSPWAPPALDDRAAPPESTLERTVAQIDGLGAACSRPDAPWRAAASARACAAGELALVLNDALLIQAARDYNLPALAGGLLERARSALPLSSTLLEAAAFVCRQQLPSGAIGAHFVIPHNASSPHVRVVTATLAECVERVRLYIQERHRGHDQPVAQGAAAWIA